MFTKEFNAKENAICTEVIKKYSYMPDCENSQISLKEHLKSSFQPHLQYNYFESI